MREADDRLLGLEVASGLTRLRGQEEATTATVMELKGLLATREVDRSEAPHNAKAREADYLDGCPLHVGSGSSSLFPSVLYPAMLAGSAHLVRLTS